MMFENMKRGELRNLAERVDERLDRQGDSIQLLGVRMEARIRALERQIGYEWETGGHYVKSGKAKTK
jgi:hypothetical protein